MAAPTKTALQQWWTPTRNPDFVAHEIVGSLGIADLVAVRFDHSAVKRRRAAGIRPLTDLLSLRVVLDCARRPRTSRELAFRLGVGESTVRRALRDAVDRGAVESLAGVYRPRPDWHPVGVRLVAVELKRSDWRRAAAQAWAYQSWAHAAWLVLGQPPPRQADEHCAAMGYGLAYLSSDSELQIVRRAKIRRSVDRVMSAWAAEQALEHALLAGVDPGADGIRPGCATFRGALAAPVG